MGWGLREAAVCTIASMALGVLVSFAVQLDNAWFFAFGPVHAICVFGCCHYARKDHAGFVFAVVAMFVPIWGFGLALFGVLIAWPLGGMNAGSEWLLALATITPPMVFWLFCLVAGLENRRVFVYGLPALVATSIALAVGLRDGLNSLFSLSAFAALPTALWQLLMPPAILIAAAEVRTREDRWRVRHECGECGYPLRDLPEPVCPECGSPVPLAFT